MLVVAHVCGQVGFSSADTQDRTDLRTQSWPAQGQSWLCEMCRKENRADTAPPRAASLPEPGLHKPHSPSKPTIPLNHSSPLLGLGDTRGRESRQGVIAGESPPPHPLTPQQSGNTKGWQQHGGELITLLPSSPFTRNTSPRAQEGHSNISNDELCGTQLAR